jgi:hypothetical protein
MKQKFSVALAVMAAAACTIAAVRSGTYPSKDPRVFILRSQGKTIAELRVTAGTSCEIQSLSAAGQAERNKTTGALTFSHGVILKLMSGTNVVRVTADEIEGRPEAD